MRHTRPDPRYSPQRWCDRLGRISNPKILPKSLDVTTQAASDGWVVVPVGFRKGGRREQSAEGGAWMERPRFSPSLQLRSPRYPAKLHTLSQRKRSVQYECSGVLVGFGDVTGTISPSRCLGACLASSVPCLPVQARNSSGRSWLLVPSQPFAGLAGSSAADFEDLREKVHSQPRISDD